MDRRNAERLFVYIINHIEKTYVEGVVSTSDYILLGECDIVNINDLTLNNCQGANYNVLLRNITNCTVQNCKDINTESLNESFFRIYTKDLGVSKNINVKNILNLKHLKKN